MLEKKIEIKDICYKDPLFMATCTNLCGNYTCECKDSSTTIVDLYDIKKCYSSTLNFNLHANIKYIFSNNFK